MTIVEWQRRLGYGRSRAHTWVTVGLRHGWLAPVPVFRQRTNGVVFSCLGYRPVAMAGPDAKVSS